MSLTRRQLAERRAEWFRTYRPYVLTYWEEYDFSVFSKILTIKRAGRGLNPDINDVIIMADTETSKKPDSQHNHIVAWTISIRAFGINIVTLYGRKPSGMIECIEKLHEAMPGVETILYFHNMAYDYTFLRRFMFQRWGYPESELNVKTHYPIIIRFDNGIIFRDSLILAQRSLDRWAKDMQVVHQKAKGKWDYDKLRNQYEDFTENELEYIEHDTLAGVECIDTMRIALNKHIYSMPYTATGIPREELCKIAAEYNAHDRFLRMAPDFEQQMKLEMVYHGGFTHSNRHFIGEIIDGAECYDEASAYPATLLEDKYPMEAFASLEDQNIDDIIRMSEQYAFMFRLIMVNPHIKDEAIPMPYLQYSKSTAVNPVLDNGRILACDYVEIYITEQDLIILADQYTYTWAKCVEVEYARKDYLPRWFTDYVYHLYKEKTELKGGDPVLYALAKARLNSVYGMCVQKPVKPTILENYETTDIDEAYKTEEQDMEALYQKYIEKPTSILPYQWGVWCTAYSARRLFLIGACVDSTYDENGIQGEWLYSDTDSCFSNRWDMEKLTAYNESIKEKLRANNYGPVVYEGREYWPGVAEHDKSYIKFRFWGSKKYCGVKPDGELAITVAGVPKKGVKCLNSIEDFKHGFVFDGETTGKLTHTYFYSDIYTDENGNEIADSIDLTTCAYLLSSIEVHSWEEILEQEETIQTYEEE